MNQTMEILFGLSKETGMALNDLISMMSNYYYYKNVLMLIMLFIALIIIVLVNYKISKYLRCNLFDFDNMILPALISTAAVVLLLTFLFNVLLGIMFPKEHMLEGIIRSMLH